MNEIQEAVIVMCKCTNKRGTYGIRTEKLGRDNWSFTWAFPLKEDAAAREGYDKTSIKGNIGFTSEYPGCPFCGNSNYVVCSCGHLSCNVKNGQFKCPWCGLQGRLTNYTGSRITAGVDA